MAAHEKFSFKTIADFKEKIEDLGLDIPFQEDLSPLFSPTRAGGKTAPNAMAVLPVEGCDSNPDGSPSELVRRRYLRYGSGGAGLIWWEACAVRTDGKANPLQMMLTRQNAGTFEQLLKDVSQKAKEALGPEHQPLHILQLTHSGRYSRPEGHRLTPAVTQRDPILDPLSGVVSDDQVITDQFLDDLTESYVNSAILAKEAGFDGVDIKACHRYLISELLASFTREGKYGGSFENRTKYLLSLIDEIKKAVGKDMIIASRFNVFDAHPYPYGFGCDHENLWKFDPEEPMRLVKELCRHGVALLAPTSGNPYYKYPQVTRPFDLSSSNIPLPEEHPLESVSRILHFASMVQENAGDVPVAGYGYSWLRWLLPYVGAANLAKRNCSFVGFGRSSFAYPEAPLDLIRHGKMFPEKCCITCSKCTQIMRDHGKAGCVVKDASVYLPLYQEAHEEALAREQK